jgi:phage gpG-like protein
VSPSHAQVEARVFGEDIVRRRFLRFSRAVSDASAAFAEIAGLLSEATRENFDTRGVSGGSRWQDLAPATVARKARRGLDPRILRATGRLYASLVGGEGSTGRARGLGGRFISGAGDHIEEITPSSLKWGSSVPYGVFHQSSAPRRVIPYRPPVRLNESQRRSVAKALQRAFVEDTRR